MSDVFAEKEGAAGIVGFFEEDEGQGFLVVYAPREREVRAQIRLYGPEDRMVLSSGDVAVLWSDNFQKCGVTVRGLMVGVIDLESQKDVLSLHSGVRDKDWLRGFNTYLDPEVFRRHRRDYWMALANDLRSNGNQDG